MYLALRICSEQLGELYSVKAGGTLSFIKKVNSDNFDIKIDPIKAIIISPTLHFWKSVDYEKDLTIEKKLFIFSDDAISELDQIYFTSVNSSSDMNSVTQAWIRRDKLSEILKIWNIKKSVPTYPEALLRNRGNEVVWIRSHETLLAYERNKLSAVILKNNIKDEIQTNISNLDITVDTKFNIPKIERRRLLTPSLILFGVILLVFNIYSYNFSYENNKYLIQTSKVQTVLDSLSKVFSEFSPGSIKEISIHDGGKNARITILDEKFEIEKIKNQLSKKYFIELKTDNLLKILILNEKVLEND